MEISDVKKMKSLEEENVRLKKMYADLAMDNQILKDLFTKKGWACIDPLILGQNGIMV